MEEKEEEEQNNKEAEKVFTSFWTLISCGRTELIFRRYLFLNPGVQSFFFQVEGFSYVPCHCVRNFSLRRHTKLFALFRNWVSAGWDLPPLFFFQAISFRLRDSNLCPLPRRRFDRICETTDIFSWTWASLRAPPFKVMECGKS